MTSRSIVVVSAGLSQPSSTRLLADRLAVATVEALRGRGDTSDAQLTEPRHRARDLVDHLLTGFPSPKLRAAIDHVLGADALIAVTPIFNASYSGLFKLFFDVLERDSLSGLPVLIGATGGTARHSLALDHAVRPLFAYLNAGVVPTAVYAASSDWGQDTAAEPALADRIDRAARELAGAVITHDPRDRADPFASPTPFEDLLRTVREG
jgi:FMN reductase